MYKGLLHQTVSPISQSMCVWEGVLWFGVGLCAWVFGMNYSLLSPLCTYTLLTKRVIKRIHIGHLSFEACFLVFSGERFSHPYVPKLDLNMFHTCVYVREYMSGQDSILGMRSLTLLSSSSGKRKLQATLWDQHLISPSFWDLHSLLHFLEVRFSFPLCS